MLFGGKNAVLILAREVRIDNEKSFLDKNTGVLYCCKSVLMRGREDAQGSNIFFKLKSWTVLSLLLF